MQVVAIAAVAAGLVGLARLLTFLDGPRATMTVRVQRFAPEDIVEVSNTLSKVSAMYGKFRNPSARTEGRRMLGVAADSEWDIHSIATDDCPALGRHTFIKFNNGRVFRLTGAEALVLDDIGSLTAYPEELLGYTPLMHVAEVFDRPEGVTIAFEGPLGRVLVNADAAVSLA
ncbi:MAG: hypothetical protein HKN93_02225 [Acidimicrobiia bacterium]|nr:hypothetical protein [Acidimicrobiia bacterium]